MTIQEIIFDLLNRSSHTWIRYFIKEKQEGLTFAGEYVIIRTMYFDNLSSKILTQNGFELEMITPIKIGADSYSDITFRRKIKN